MDLPRFVLRLSVAAGCVVLSLYSIPMPASATPAPALYGITAPANNRLTIVQIDPTNAHILRRQIFSLSGNEPITAFAFHTPSGHFVAIQSTPSASPPTRLLEFNATTGVTSEHVVVGLPPGEGYAQGLEYVDSQGRLVVSFGQSNSNTQRRIAELALDGTVGACVTGTLPPPDIDFLVETGDGRLCGYDSNDNPRLFQINNLCTSPATVDLGVQVPANSNLSDPAFSDANDMFTADEVTHVLYELLPSSYSPHGDLGEDIVGLAFGPPQAIPVPNPGRSGLMVLGLAMIVLGASQVLRIGRAWTAAS